MGSAAALVGVAGFCALRYKVALPNQRLVRTGLGIKGMHISQKCVHWPFQQLRVLDLTPFTVKVRVMAMSKKRIDISLPTVWTLAPDARTLVQINESKTVKDVSPLQRYATRLMTMTEAERAHFFEQYIQGEARIIAGNMDLEDLASNRTQVQKELRDKLAVDFEEVGVHILNGNIEDLHDTDGQKYFEQIRQKALREAESAAKVATAEAERTGNVGKAEADAKSQIDVAKHKREALVAENLQKEQEWTSKAKLQEVQSDAERRMAIAKAFQQAEAEKKTNELQKGVEEARLEQRLAKERAENLSTIKIDAEGVLAKAKGEADAQVALAKALLEAERMRAAGIQSVLEAQAAGLQRLREAAGGTMSDLTAYLFYERKGPEQVTSSFGEAVRDMKPHITVWNRDNEKGAGQAVTDFLGMMPHFLTAMGKQTGFQILPQLFPQTKSPSSSEHPPCPPSEK